jgi:hypothetical protein
VLLPICLHGSLPLHAPLLGKVLLSIMFLLSEGNSGQPGLPDPVVLQADILQSDHASIHGVVDGSTTGPFFIN